MKKYLYLLRLLTPAVLMIPFLSGSCTHDHNTAASGLKRSAHTEAMETYNTGSVKDAIAKQQEAVDALRKGHIPDPAFAVLSQMGYFQCRAGNYAEGLRFLQEASDSLHTVPRDSMEAEEAVKLLGNLSNLYTRFALYDEALQKNDEALTLAGNLYPDRLADLWRMRGTIFDYMQLPDSQLYCLRKAVKAAYAIRDPELRAPAIVFTQNNKAWFFIEHSEYAPDSIPQAVDNLRGSRYDTKSHSNTNLLLAGRGYVLMGDHIHGIPMMEKAVGGLREWGSMEQLEWGLTLLAKSYAATRNSKLLDIYGEATALHDTMMQKQRDDQLLGMDFRYRTSELQTQNKLLATELSLSRQRTVFLVSGIALILCSVFAFSHYRRRQNRKLMRQKEENIETLLSERIILNSHIEALNSMLADRMMADGSNDISLTPMLLEKADEIRFRKIFSELHPGFIERLRKEYPSLTSGNELLCMLIALHKTNDEISFALGISRESVATARYRLRSRFSLPKEADLNEFILSKL